ncbi:MAG: excinuclease ABC subunit C, partial [archaeon]
ADKANYRRFKIKSFKENEINDYKAINEVVKRRYTRLIAENKTFPNLIIIDGGKGQLSSAKDALEEIGINNQEIISIAKREEEIYLANNLFPIKLNKKEKSLQLIQKIRDEAHRFAISYQKKLRSLKNKNTK